MFKEAQVQRLLMGLNAPRNRMVPANVDPSYKIILCRVKIALSVGVPFDLEFWTYLAMDLYFLHASHFPRYTLKGRTAHQ